MESKQKMVTSWTRIIFSSDDYKLKMAESVILSDNWPDSDVITGVMDGVRQSFIDSGVDMAVLAKLEQLWVSKLSSAGSPGVAIADVMVPGAVPKGKESEYR